MNKYCKIAPIEAEQFDGSDEMAIRYNFEKYLGSWGNRYTHDTIVEVGDWFVKLVDDDFVVMGNEEFKKSYVED